MTLPASGTISLSQVNSELGYSATVPISLNEAAVRTLAGKSSGLISMADLMGKSNEFVLTISTNMVDVNIRNLAVTYGWNQQSILRVVVNSGVYVYSTNVYGAAMTIAGSFPGGVYLLNHGMILGKGGTGGVGYGGLVYMMPGSPGSPGGVGLQVQSPATITNYGSISGGGGGGGGGYYLDYFDDMPLWGGGGGGGVGNGSGAPPINNTNGGSAGTLVSGGAGGLGTTWLNKWGYSGGAGGGYGASGVAGVYGYAGGAGGAAISGNGYITWAAAGNRYGAIL